MRQQRAPKPPVDMTRVLPREIVLVLQRVGGRLASHPARDVALWLACVPLILPAPVIAGSIALSSRIKGNRDPRWRLVIAISIVNFLLSAVAVAWISTILGGWVADRLHDLLGPLFLWPSDPRPTPIPV